MKMKQTLNAQPETLTLDNALSWTLGVGRWALDVLC